MVLYICFHCKKKKEYMSTEKQYEPTDFLTRFSADNETVRLYYNVKDVGIVTCHGFAISDADEGKS